MNSAPHWVRTQDVSDIGVDAATALMHASWQHQRASINLRLVGLWLGVATLQLLSAHALMYPVWRTVAYYTVGLAMAVTAFGAASCHLRRIATRAVFAHAPNLDFTERSLVLLRLAGTGLLMIELLFLAAFARLELTLLLQP